MLTVVGPVGADAHDGGSHPERPSRIDAVMEGVRHVGQVLGSELELVPAEPVPRAALERVHAAPYVAQVELLCTEGGGRIDPDTYVREDSWDTALRSAGAGLQAVEALRGRSNSGVAFVATRPPGHHALSDRGMGFCIFNNVAVTAAALAAEGERVLIVDWDVHHGNGTQAVFWDDPSVLYVSTHQSPLYPGTGAAEEVGGPNARGLTVNVPLPAGSTGDAVLRALGEVAAPVIDAFAPTWVLISAGFDAHRADPLAELSLSSGDFASLARTVAGFGAAGGGLVVFLEGGYDLDALRSSVAATLGALSGVGEGEMPGAEAVTSGGPGSEAVDRAALARARALGAAGG
ncbi:MAG TPA: histone deacetylase [Acidimicrobiales bacterium]|nr:histone deacetylase [Acidimicrobiales bacterium]